MRMRPIMVGGEPRRPALDSSDSTRNLEVIALDPGSDGMVQVTAALAQWNGIDAAHILWHRQEGGFTLRTETCYGSVPTAGTASVVVTLTSVTKLVGGGTAPVGTFGANASNGARARRSDAYSFTKRDLGGVGS